MQVLIEMFHPAIFYCPKIKPYIPAMIACIASILKIDADMISIKATTTETMGFVGREEGVVAHAVVLLQKD